MAVNVGDNGFWGPAPCGRMRGAILARSQHGAGRRFLASRASRPWLAIFSAGGGSVGPGTGGKVGAPIREAPHKIARYREIYGYRSV